MHVAHCTWYTWSVSVAEVAEARPLPVLRMGQPTLAATVPTVMLLVDYSLAGKTIPSPELQRLAERLPDQVVHDSGPVRAAMAHGAVLRTVLLNHLSPDHRGHTDWSTLRSWIADLDDGDIHWLIDQGVGAVMQYGKPPRNPTPPQPKLKPLAGPSATVRRHAVEVLEAWHVPNPKRRARELEDAAGFRASLLQLLDAIWAGWLQRSWTQNLTSMQAVTSHAPPPPAGCSGAQWIRLTTGMLPDDQYAAAADNARELIITPSPGLGSSLALFSTESTWVLFTPRDAPTRTNRVGVSVGNLASLAPIMQTLGDHTRLALVLHLLDHGPQTMQQLAAALNVHPSTISRQVAALREAGIARINNDRQVTANHQAVIRAGRTLIEAAQHSPN